MNRSIYISIIIGVLLFVIPASVFVLTLDDSSAPQYNSHPVKHPPVTFVRGVAVAKAYWRTRHVSTPCGTVNLVLVNRIPNLFVPNATGGAQKGVCEILFTRIWFKQALAEPGLICASIIHELGHIDGLNHSPDPNNVMHLQQTFVPHECL